jgi:DNA relaxase NicK
MRWLFAVLMVSLAFLVPWPTRAGEVKETKSALESDPRGWVDLLTEKAWPQWKRVAIPPGGKLREKSPWRLDQATATLVCEGVGVHEMLLYDKELGDGIFHIEWRFKKLEEGKKGYNSGVYVRNSADGKIWHQAQVGSKNVGFLFGDTLMDGKLKRVRIADKVPQRGKEAGEWNIYEITFKGKEITLWINGAVTARWSECEVPRGYVGVEAEGYLIEFKNAKLKEFK